MLGPNLVGNRVENDHENRKATNEARNVTERYELPADLRSAKTAAAARSPLRIAPSMERVSQ